LFCLSGIFLDYVSTGGMALGAKNKGGNGLAWGGWHLAVERCHDGDKDDDMEYWKSQKLEGQWTNWFPGGSFV
jgi:hypothetical protein